MTSALPNPTQVSKFVRYLFAKNTPPNPQTTLLLCPSSLETDTQNIANDRYVGVEPVKADSAAEIRSALLKKGDMDCLILNYHGTDAGELYLNGPQRELSQLADDLGGNLPTIRKHIVFEGCRVGRKPTQMNIFAKRFGSPTMEGPDRYAAHSNVEIDIVRPKPSNEAEKIALNDDVAQVLQNAVLTRAPEPSNFKIFVLGGGEAEYNRIHKTLVETLIKKGSVKKNVILEWFSLDKSEIDPTKHNYLTRQEMRQSLLIIDSETAAVAAQNHYSNGIQTETDFPGHIVRVQPW